VESQGDHLPSLVNDYTVEAAVVMMEKIGYKIDEKLRSIQAREEIGEQKKDVEESKHADPSLKDKIIKIFDRLNELASGSSVPTICTRVRMLIKNMFDNRAKGWESAKKQEEFEPTKVHGLRE
jgi:hypothetical protein